ncbi:hypothetical protein IFM89_037249, partial [Coptis chinensis]
KILSSFGFNDHRVQYGDVRGAVRYPTRSSSMVDLGGYCHSKRAPHSTVDFKAMADQIWHQKQLPITIYLGSPTCLSRELQASPSTQFFRDLQQKDSDYGRHLPSQAAQLMSIGRAFLRGHDINTFAVLSVNRDTIENQRLRGGLGVHNLQHTNLALLAKKAWAVIASGKSLWVDIVKAKYLRKHDFLTVCPNPTDSRVWKDILKARSVLHKGLGWKIGDGTSINLSTDSWIPGNEGVIAPISLTNSISPLFVSDLIDSTTRKWRSNIIYHCWPEDIAKQIISIPLSLSANPDERIWTLSVNGKYTVKSGYHALHSTNTTPLFDWRIIWTLKCPPRVKVFMWKLSRDALKSSSNLFRFGLNINADCIFVRTTTGHSTTPLS